MFKGTDNPNNAWATINESEWRLKGKGGQEMRGPAGGSSNASGHIIHSKRIGLDGRLSRAFLRIFILAVCFGSALAQSITLKSNYTGFDFFDAWSYQTGKDDGDGPLTRLFGITQTSGSVNWTSQDFAIQNGLTSVNAHGNVVIKVDNTTSGSPTDTFLRNSVFLLSQDTVNFGDLVLIDLLHSPFGCSVWPSFWMAGRTWPQNGQINVIGNANMESTSQYALLAATDGCTHPAASLVNETGVLVSPNCAYNAAPAKFTTGGCVVQDIEQPVHLSFGVNFADNGGGVFAMFWNSVGIRMWFFSRGHGGPIPLDISSGRPDPSSWPAPAAFYPSSSCNSSEFFGPQSMVIQTNICGTFTQSMFSRTCQGSCLDLVGNPANYANAYWEIRSMAIFSSEESISESSVSDSGSPSGTSSGATSSTSNSNSTMPSHGPNGVSGSVSPSGTSTTSNGNTNGTNGTNSMPGQGPNPNDGQHSKNHILAPIIGGTVGGLVLILAIAWAFIRQRSSQHKLRSKEESASLVNPFVHQIRFSAHTSSTDRGTSKKSTSRYKSSVPDNAQLSSPVTPQSTQRSSRFRLHEDSGEDIMQPEGTDDDVIDLPPIYNTVPMRRTVQPESPPRIDTAIAKGPAIQTSSPGNQREW